MRNQFFKIILVVSSLTVMTAAQADLYLSARPAAVGSTLGDGSLIGINLEGISESDFGWTTELNFRGAKNDDYLRSDFQAIVGADLKFSPYISVISSLVFQLSQSRIENEYSLIKSKTQTVGLSNGLSSRWVFGGGFYFAMDWLSVFTPLNTTQTSFTLQEKLRIYVSEQRRIEDSFLRTEIMGNGTFLSPRIGWKF